jgi:DNA-directed RNA polymerase specialized sigma24 family protein
VADLQRGEIESQADSGWFHAFVENNGARLRRALVAAYGVQVGNDVCADALAWAWEHRAALRSMEDPVRYLYRVGQSAARRQHRWRREIRLPPEVETPVVPSGSPRLDDALTRLNERQRTVVILIHAHGHSYAEVAELLGLSEASVRNQLHRGMQRLRTELRDGS